MLLLILSSMGIAKQTVSGYAGQVNLKACLMCSYGDDADGTGALDCPTLSVCIQVIYVHKSPSFVAVHTSYKPPTSACYSEHAYLNKSKTHLTLDSKAFVRNAVTVVAPVQQLPYLSTVQLIQKPCLQSA